MESPKFPPVSNPYGVVPQYKPNEHSKAKEPERKRADSDPPVPTSPSTTSPSVLRAFGSAPTRPRSGRIDQAFQPGLLPLPLSTRASRSSEEIPPRASSSSEDISPRASSSSKSEALIDSLDRGNGHEEKIGEILRSVGEIPYAPVKLKMLMQLVSRINQKFGAAPAAKLIAERVEPMVREFAASMEFTEQSQVGKLVRDLYLAMKLPIEPVWKLRGHILAAQEPEVRAPEPVARAQSRVWVSDEVLNVRTRIGFLEKGSDPAQFAAACKYILTLADEIGNVRDKLDALKRLVTQINVCSASDPVSAGKIFVEDVEPLATELAATKEVAYDPEAGAKLDGLFEAMGGPIDIYIESRAAS